MATFVYMHNRSFQEVLDYMNVLTDWNPFEPANDRTRAYEPFLLRFITFKHRMPSEHGHPP